MGKVILLPFFSYTTIECPLVYTYCRDKAIPALDALSMIDRGGNGSDQDALEQSRLSIILENQIKQEKVVANMIQEETDESYPNLRTEAHPPPVSQEFQAARLLLTHLGFIAVQVSLFVFVE